MYKMRDLIDEGWGEAEVHGFGPIDDVYKHISSDGKKYVSIDIFLSATFSVVAILVILILLLL